MSIFGKDKFFSICFMLISAATGMGILTLPWSFRQTGLVLGILILIYWSVLCGSTVYLLIIGGLYYKVDNITELVYYSILGEVKIENDRFDLDLKSLREKTIREKLADKAAVICDIIILFDCLFMIPCLLIFLSDFLIPINQLVQQELPKLPLQYPSLVNSMLFRFSYKTLIGISSFFAEKYRCIIFFCSIVFLISLPRNSSAIRLASVLSVFSSISTTIIVLYNGLSSKKPPECLDHLIENNSNYCRSGNIELFSHVSIKEFWRITSVSNIILFSHFCHLILIPATKNIHRMSSRKIKLIVFVFVSTIFVFNCSVGISGYSIFRSNTLPNIINNFAYNDPLIVMTRIYLSLSLTVTICMETMPLTDSFSSTSKLLLNSIKRVFKRINYIEAEIVGGKDKNPVSNSGALVEDDNSSNNCTSTLASTGNLTPYVVINELKDYSEVEVEDEQKKHNCGKSCVNSIFKENIFRIFNLIIVLVFSGIIAMSFSSVAKLIQITGGTLDGIFVFVIPAWVYYSTYFRFHNKFLGISLITLYILHFIVSSLSGIVGLFKIN